MKNKINSVNKIDPEDGYIGFRKKRHKIDMDYNGNIDMSMEEIYHNIIEKFDKYFVEYQDRTYVNIYNYNLKFTTASLVKWLYLLKVKIKKTPMERYVSIRKIIISNSDVNIDMLDPQIHEVIMKNYRDFILGYNQYKRNKLSEVDIIKVIYELCYSLIIYTDKLIISDMQIRLPLYSTDFTRIRFKYIKRLERIIYPRFQC